MVRVLCLKYKCKDCPEQKVCFGCEHIYILIKAESATNLYKCSKCGNKLRLDKKNPCCECINSCKGKITNVINNKDKIYKICNQFQKK